jgi:uncharacterized protein with HEPN domain
MNRDREFLMDILVAAKLAAGYISGKSRAQFMADVECQDAVIRRLMIIGEAAKRISEATQGALANLPWHEMVSMRNVMIHGYDDIDLNIVWDTAAKDLPPLIKDLDLYFGSSDS